MLMYFAALVSEQFSSGYTEEDSAKNNIIFLGVYTYSTRALVCVCFIFICSNSRTFLINNRE